MYDLEQQKDNTNPKEYKSIFKLSFVKEERRTFVSLLLHFTV